MSFLISTTQDPWVSATAQGNYLPKGVATLRSAAKVAAVQVMKQNGLLHV